VTSPPTTTTGRGATDQDGSDASTSGDAARSLDHLEPVRAAGAVVWRRARGADGAGASGLEVLLVHSGRYGEWAWPKGKPEAGETMAECAVREVAEESGARVLLGRPLPPTRYVLPDGRDKQVAYWAAQAVAERPRTAPDTEIDDRAWVSVSDARERLDRAGDRGPLEALVAMAEREELATRPVLLVRHTQARPRDSWARADAERPLVGAGRRQALALGSLLQCWRPRYVLSSPWRRCLQTVEPYAAAAGVRVRTKGGLTESGYRRHPQKAGKHTRRLLEHDDAALLCTHRPVLAAVMATLRRAATAEAAAGVPDHDPWLAAGEVLVAHVVRRGDIRRVVAVERHGA
jgi:8-oxo-dGTP diphosphatase